MAPRYFLAWILYTALYLAVGAEQPQYALKGESVVLKPNIVDQPDSILWKHGGNKVVEFNGKEEQVFGKYENRITLDWLSAQVTISDLRLEDSGEYELEVDIKDRPYRSSYQLVVMENVSIPSIKCEMTNGSSANVSGQLLCTAEPKQPQSLMKFEWRAHGGMQDGPWLGIPLGGIHDDEVYTCSVSNPLSSEKAKYMAKDCYPVESSSLTAILVSVSLVLLVLLVSGFLLYMYRSQVCECFQKDVEKGQRPPTKTGSHGLNAQREETNSLLPNKDSSHVAEACDESIEVRTPPKEKMKLLKDIYEGRSPPIKDTDEPQKTSPHDSSLHSGVTSPLTRNNLPSNVQSDVDTDQQNESEEEEKPSGPEMGNELNHQRSTLKKDEAQETSPCDSSQGQGDVVTDQQNEPKEEEKPSDPQRGTEPHPASWTEDLEEGTQSDPTACDESIEAWTPPKDEPQKTSPHDSPLPGVVTSPLTQNNPSKGQGDVDTNQQNETKKEEKPSAPKRGKKLNHQRSPLKKDTDKPQKTSPHDSSLHSGVTSQTTLNNIPSKGLGDVVTNQQNESEEGEKPSDHGGQETSPCDSSQGQGDVVTDQHDKEEEKSSDPQRGNEPQPAVVTEDLEEDTQSVLKPPIPPKQPACDVNKADWTPQRDEGQETPHDSPLPEVTSQTTLNNLPSKGQDGGQETSPCDSSQGQGDVVTDQQNEPKEEEKPSDPQRGNESQPAVVTEDLEEGTQSDPTACDVNKADWTPQKDDPQKTSPHDSSLHSGVTSPLTQNNLPSKGQGDVDTDQQNETKEEEKPSDHGGQETSCDSSQGQGDVDTDQQNEPKEEEKSSDPQRGNEPPPASVTEDLKEDIHSDVDLTSKQPDPQKKADEEAQSAPAGPEPQSPLVSSSPDTASKDRAGEHKGDTDLDQVAEKTFKESDTSDKEERSESDDSIKHKQSSTMPEQNGSEEALQEHNLNMSQEEAQADTMSVKTAKPVSENESKTDSISEETDKEQDMYSSPVQKAQSPAQDHRNTPDQPDQTAGQSEKGESEVQCDFKEETPRSESCREDEDGQSKDKVTASSILANTKKL